MPSLRQERVNSLLLEELSRLLEQELREDLPALITLTGVEVAPDLRTALVYASVLGDDAQVAAAITYLRAQRKYLQRRIGENLTLRYTPKLHFVSDLTAAHAQRVEELLARIATEPPLPGEPQLLADEDDEADDDLED